MPRSRPGVPAPPPQLDWTRLRRFLVLGTEGGAFSASEQDIGFRQLADLPLVLASRPNGLRVALDQLCRREHVQIKVAVEADSLLTMKDLVLQAGVFTVLPHQLVHEELAQGTLTAARLVRPELPRVLSLATTARHPTTSAMRAVAHELREVVQHELVDRVWR